MSGGVTASVLFLLVLIGGVLDRGAAQDGADLSRLRAFYLGAVEDPADIEHGIEEIAALAGRTSGSGAELQNQTLRAYAGALRTLRAKHAAWPQQKLAYLREGLELLDGVISENPRHAEARYLRLMTCYHLPAIFGRRETVREDFRALARLLPPLRGEYPERLYQSIARFVLQKGSLLPAERVDLERALVETNE